MNTAVATKPATQVAKPESLAVQLADLRPELEKVLPAHITPDKFLRVVNTAISQSPDLYKADRRSLFTSCVKCATDGLVPDGREAALVIFNSKEKYTDEQGRKQERWVKKVQYMPMVAGILKKIRNSGELKSITCNVAYEKDDFRYWTDDVGEHITHEPNIRDPDRGKFLAVYAILKTNDGGTYTEVMTRGQVDQVRAVSKSKDDGPWVSWYDEMAKKTVIRRVSKRAPMSTDIERVVRRDDEMYDLRTRQVSASSGSEATKALLGISAPASYAGDDNESESTDGFTDESAIQALRECGDARQLTELWAEIKADYIGSNREIPVNVEAVHNDRKEALGPSPPSKL
jgi:recombination protein RecT